MSKKKTNIEQVATIKTSSGKAHQNSDILSGGGICHCLYAGQYKRAPRILVRRKNTNE